MLRGLLVLGLLLALVLGLVLRSLLLRMPEQLFPQRTIAPGTPGAHVRTGNSQAASARPSSVASSAAVCRPPKMGEPGSNAVPASRGPA
jgi:hypothetical protein